MENIERTVKKIEKEHLLRKAAFISLTSLAGVGAGAVLSIPIGIGGYLVSTLGYSYEKGISFTESLSTPDTINATLGLYLLSTGFMAFKFVGSYLRENKNKFYNFLCS